jgi:predicted secreted protein
VGDYLCLFDQGGTTMKKIFVGCVVIAVVIIAGLRCTVANNTQTPLSYEAYQYTDPARPLIVSPGDKFFIVIASNRTTGFSWQIAKPINEKVVKLQGLEYLPAKSNLVGAGGKEIWAFNAVAPGQTIISLRYSRPWEKGKPPKQEAVYTVIVR